MPWKEVYQEFSRRGRYTIILRGYEYEGDEKGYRTLGGIFGGLVECSFKVISRYVFTNALGALEISAPGGRS